MARDPDRIDEVLDELESYWREHPDLRLGQALCVLADGAGYGRDPFYLEDGALLRELRRQQSHGRAAGRARTE